MQIPLAAIGTYESAGLIHQMATFDATKVLLLTNQAKLTLTVALTLTDTVAVIFFMHILLTPIKMLHQFGSGRNKFVQLLIRSRNSSGWFVRSLYLRLFEVAGSHAYCRSGNVSEIVRDRDIVTIDH